MLHVKHGQARRPEHTFRWHHPFASTDEKLEAYVKEKQTWISNQAMECISKINVPKGGNVLKSSFIYKWKNQVNLKARIVPDGRGDSQKYVLRTDSPKMSLDAFRMMMLIAAESWWSLGSLDIKAAYLQADDFNREIYVTPP
jgi:Reverse transcriptase (RNA-dependent DNA polymerase)